LRIDDEYAPDLPVFSGWVLEERRMNGTIAFEMAVFWSLWSTRFGLFRAISLEKSFGLATYYPLRRAFDIRPHTTAIDCPI
jgi:hypothetical protein